MKITNNKTLFQGELEAASLQKLIMPVQFRLPKNNKICINEYVNGQH